MATTAETVEQTILYNRNIPYRIQNNETRYEYRKLPLNNKKINTRWKCSPHCHRRMYVSDDVKQDMWGGIVLSSFFYSNVRSKTHNLQNNPPMNESGKVLSVTAVRYNTSLHKTFISKTNKFGGWHDTTSIIWLWVKAQTWQTQQCCWHCPVGIRQDVRICLPEGTHTNSTFHSKPPPNWWSVWTS